MPAAVVSRQHMNAVLVPLLHFPPQQATVFFEALTAADKAVELVERLDWLASFAPPVMMNGYCSCGSEFEVRSRPIELTDDERAAVADALGGLDVGDIVAGAINGARDHEHHEAFTDWYDAHAYCDGGDDL